jgi:hypothetical protein
MAALWREMQTELASQNGLGVLIVADTKDHYIHLRRPQVVVDGIRTAVEAGRSHR